MTRRVSSTSPPLNHYENFPVASWLCPAHLRPAVAAIYWFARTADDLADEGEASATTRLDDLRAYRSDLQALTRGQADSGRWRQVFAPLGRILRDFHLPVALLLQLLDAFEQDIRFTGEQRRYQDDAELLDYCSRSANPVGRLLLHLYGVEDQRSLAQSDQICSALQLINFWQDLSVDIARERWYPSRASMHQHAVTDADLRGCGDAAKATHLVQAYCRAARLMMLAGAPLATRLPGRIGWELRLVVQGGLRILDKIEAMRFESWRQRPKLDWRDLPRLLWRAWRMG